jgi:hypothetical protein
MRASRRPISELQQRPTAACNDNGALRLPGLGANSPDVGIVRAAAEIAGPIAMSYLAAGVFMIGRQQGRRTPSGLAPA